MKLDHCTVCRYFQLLVKTVTTKLRLLCFCEGSVVGSVCVLEYFHFTSYSPQCVIGKEFEDVGFNHLGSPYWLNVKSMNGPFLYPAVLLISDFRQWPLVIEFHWCHSGIILRSGSREATWQIAARAIWSVSSLDIFRAVVLTFSGFHPFGPNQHMKTFEAKAFAILLKHFHEPVWTSSKVY